jgi:hypothetical protein
MSSTFHKLPGVLYRRDGYKRLSLIAGRLLVDAHMYSDELEQDGTMDLRDFMALAGYAGIPSSRVPRAVDEMVASELVERVADGYLLVDFQGTPHAIREKKREEERVKKAGQRSRQRANATPTLSDVPGGHPTGQPEGLLPGVPSPTEYRGQRDVQIETSSVASREKGEPAVKAAPGQVPPLDPPPAIAFPGARTSTSAGESRPPLGELHNLTRAHVAARHRGDPSDVLESNGTTGP